jgi:hypothetical protein
VNEKNKIGVAGIKAGIATAASAASGDWKITVATAISEILSVGVDAFSGMSQKRTQALFDSPELATKVVEEIKKSDDFASLIFDLWRRYNYESSEERRLMLKSILQHATYDEERNYENFSKLFLVVQQVTGTELIVVKAFYLPDAHTYSDNRNNSTEDFQLNVHEIQRLLTEKQIGEGVVVELAQDLTQLGNYGLIAERPATLGGPYYTPLRFGRVFLDYVKS